MSVTTRFLVPLGAADLIDLFMADPFPTGAAPAGALVRIMGHPWTLTVSFVQPSDLAGCQSFGAVPGITFELCGFADTLRVRTGQSQSPVPPVCAPPEFGA